MECWVALVYFLLLGLRVVRCLEKYRERKELDRRITEECARCGRSKSECRDCFGRNASGRSGDVL